MAKINNDDLYQLPAQEVVFFNDNELDRYAIANGHLSACACAFLCNVISYCDFCRLGLELSNTNKYEKVDAEFIETIDTLYNAIMGQFQEINSRFIKAKSFYKLSETSYNRLKIAYHNSMRRLSNDYELGLYDNSKTTFVRENILLRIGENKIKAMAKSGAFGVMNNEASGSFNFANSDTTFKDVAGLSEVKEELTQIIDFIKNSEKYQRHGAKLLKGIMMYGPPGTGKTLLAKAVAGEANVKFIAVNGSDFTAKYWGVVPKMIKELFETARQNAPCIIFIDEIDMLGASRGSDVGGSAAHRETLNAFLAEVDGFNKEMNNGVMLIGATNRLEDLDKAFIRPGRFDRLISVPLPNDVKEIQEVLDICLKQKELDLGVYRSDLAKKFFGFSPAEIDGVVNDACLISIRRNNGVITEEHINEAILKYRVKGNVKKDVSDDYNVRKMTAIHEAGHAVMALINGLDLQSVTILPTTSGAGGITSLEANNKLYFNKKDYEAQIVVSYGGRAAEEVFYGRDLITTGASADIKRATELIRSAASNYGFDMYDDQAHAPIVYNHISQKNVEKAANKYYALTVEEVKKYKTGLMNIADALMEKGTISGKEAKSLMEQRYIEDKKHNLLASLFG